MFAVLITACGGDTAETTTTVPPTTTPSTSTTTTTVPTEVEIPASGVLKFRPGTTYVASGFWEPVSFTTEEDGWWWSQGSGGDITLAVHVEYHEHGESPWDLDVSVIAPEPTRGVDEIVSDIVDDDRLVLAADPMTATVAGYDARVLDVVGVGVEQGGFADDPCLDRGGRGNSRFWGIDPGFDILKTQDKGLGGDWAFGVRSCRAARIWVVDVEGSTIVIIAATYNEELFDELIPAAEALIAGIEFHP